MGEYYTYQKKRRQFGKPCNQFEDSDIKHCVSLASTTSTYEYKRRNPNFMVFDNISELSEHSVNTERVKTNDKGMYHKEGGWPSGVDPTEPNDTAKYKKKIQRDTQFQTSVKDLCEQIQRSVQQNNQIDMFEQYFKGETSDHIVENLSAKTLMLFKDDNKDFKRSVSEISWSPDGPNQLVVSYAIMRFQKMPEKMNTEALVWDLSKPNSPEFRLNSPSPVTNIAYNPKVTDQIGGGCYNGLVAIWDVKKSNQPTFVTPVTESHSDPITHFHWMQSKTGSEFVTTSTDGKVLWWDLRKLDTYVEMLSITETNNEGVESVIGGTVLEYNVQAGPSKFLIGTESGSILTANKKPKRNVEITTRYGQDGGRHLGPVYSIHRSPPATKYFLSVGDWSCKVWVEDLKTPIIRTQYHGAYLTDGCWSPTRPGAFFLVRKDGWMDVWDYYYRQNEIAYSHKVSDSPLTCIKINSTSNSLHNTGKLAAIGDQDGTVTLLEFCESLYTLQPRQKEIVSEMFDREFRKEKNLEQLKKQQELAQKNVPKENTAAKQKWENKKNELLKEVDTKFDELMKSLPQDDEDDLHELDSPQAQKEEKKEGSVPPVQPEKPKSGTERKEPVDQPKPEVEQPKNEESQQPAQEENQALNPPAESKPQDTVPPAGEQPNQSKPEEEPPAA